MLGSLAAGRGGGGGGRGGGGGEGGGSWVSGTVGLGEDGALVDDEDSF